MFLSWTEWAVVMLIGKFWFISDLNVGFENHNKYMLYKSILICWVSHDNAMHCFDSAVNNSNGVIILQVIYSLFDLFLVL